MGLDSKIGNFKPEIVLLYCRNCLAKDSGPVGNVASNSKFSARLVMLPCSSKVEASQVLKILAQGADGVEVVGCPEKQCRFLIGNTRAEKRIEYARQLLGKIKFDMDRLGMDRGENLSLSQLISLAEKRANAVMNIGPNPMKG